MAVVRIMSQINRLRLGVVTVVALGLMNLAPSHPAAAEAPLLVGLGDSYTSGEGVAPYEPGTSATGCDRSNDAYPLLAARTLGARSRNVACSGSVLSALDHWTGGRPPQLDGVAGASWAVMTIGGNDLGASGEARADLAGYRSRLDELQARLDLAVRSVGQRAPGARVLVLGYPDIFPSTQAALDRCTGTLGAQVQVADLHSAVAALDERVRRAAIAGGGRYLDTSAAFTGHDACSAVPYANGPDARFGKGALHPNAAGQRAMADVVVAALRPDLPAAARPASSPALAASVDGPVATATTARSVPSDLGRLAASTTLPSGVVDLSGAAVVRPARPTTAAERASWSAEVALVVAATAGAALVVLGLRAARAGRKAWRGT